MLPVRDIDRMVAFSGDGFGLTVVFYPPLWTRWQRVRRPRRANHGHLCGRSAYRDSDEGVPGPAWAGQARGRRPATAAHRPWRRRRRLGVNCPSTGSVFGPAQSSTRARHGPARRPTSGVGCSASTPSRAPGLAPNDDPTAWVGRLTAETADVMLVGHLPHLAKLASLLLTGNPDGQLIGFQQAGLVVFEHTEAGWTVTLLLPPSAA